MVAGLSLISGLRLITLCKTGHALHTPSSDTKQSWFRCETGNPGYLQWV